jgi:hypothetical protein
MKKVVLGIIAGLALGAGATWVALPHAATAEPAKAEAAAPAEKPKENPLHLNAAKRAATGVTLAKPESATLAPELSAFGRVLDPSPLIALVAELETAQAALVASEKDAARTQQLYDAGTNASAQVLEVAAAAAARDRAAGASARARLVAGWGRRLADASELKGVVTELESGASLVRIDALPGDLPAVDLKKAAVGLVGGTEMVDADILGAAPVADSQLQGASFLAFVRGRTLPIGAALRATLAGPGEPVKTLVVPRSAIVYYQGSAWIYVLGEEDTFERKVVTLGRAAGDGVAVSSGLDDGEQVAVTGAGQLLSAELQAGGAPDEG